MHKNTIIVIWGDHGWKLGEYGRWSKHSTLDIDTRVPLIIVPTVEKNKKLQSRYVELIDLYPTLTNLAGLDKPKHLQGIDIFSETKKNYVLSQIEHEGYTCYSLRNPQYRYSVWLNESGENLVFEELYDITQKGFEWINVADSSHHKEIKEKLFMILKNENRLAI